MNKMGIMLRIFLVSGLFSILMGGSFYGQISAQEGPVSGVNEKKVIIVYKQDVKQSDIIDLKNKNAKIKAQFKIIPAVAASINEKQIAAIKLNKNIVDVFEDAPVHATLSTSVPQIDADMVHSDGVSGSGVKVCIVDTGVDDSHPALNPLIAEYDFVNDDPDATDDNEHGTHVAGIVASTDSTYGGVAPGSEIIGVKVLNQFGSGSTSDVILGVEFCVENGADVISMSLSGANFQTPCDSQPLAMASNQAVAQGVVVVAATGNDNQPNKVGNPACGSNVIAVGAVDSIDGFQKWSNRGSLLDVVAPGVGITSTGLGGSFVSKTGTSMATPHVSGTVALMLSADPTLTPAQVRTNLRNTAVDLGTPGFDNTFGFGRIDAFSAYGGEFCGIPRTSFSNIILGTPANDVLSGTSVDDLILGDNGNDIIVGGGGNDCILGGGGNDFIKGQGGDDTLFGQAGTDYLKGSAGNDLIYGGDGNDYILGVAGDDIMWGGENDDYLRGGSGIDLMYGEDGNDFFFIGAGTNTVFGGMGNDIVFAGPEISIIYGGPGNDWVTGISGDDTILGGDGNDILDGGLGTNSIDGGNGFDLCIDAVNPPINCEI